MSEYKEPREVGKGTGLAMTTSLEDSVELEAKTVTPPRHSHHKARRRKRIAARILLVLGIVIGVLAVFDFAYNAYIFTYYVQPRSSDSPIIGSLGDEVGTSVIAPEFYDPMQRDAIVVLIAVALLITSVVISRRIKRHRR